MCTTSGRSGMTLDLFWLKFQSHLRNEHCFPFCTVLYCFLALLHQNLMTIALLYMLNDRRQEREEMAIIGMSLASVS